MSRDLDWSDYEADGQRMAIEQAEQEYAERCARVREAFHGMEPWKAVKGISHLVGILAASVESDVLDECVESALAYVQDEEQAERLGPRIIEATCGKCREVFIPHSESPDDLIHGVREDGQECGGAGTVDGVWHP